MIYQRGGRCCSNEVFKFEEEIIEIVKEYQYFGVIFSNSCLFRKAAEHFKRTGLQALVSVWNLLSNGRISNWDSHQKLFHTLINSVVLYSGQVWPSLYPDVLEKVQSQFLRRLYHLDFKTPTFAMRLDTKSIKVEITIGKLLLNFAIRILQMESSRISKMCYITLLKASDSDQIRYNWTSNLKELLTRTNHNHLWPYNDPM
jgi:hypothetical protein